MMINRMPFKSQPMNMVHKSRHGTQIWLGDYYGATNLSLLKRNQIKSVLTAAAMLNIQYPKEMQMNHKTLNAFDVPTYKMSVHFQEAFQFIDDALKKGNLYVHCAAGISRSTTCILVYLIRREGMTFSQGLNYIRSKRSIVNPNEGFVRELKKFELTMKNRPREEEFQKKQYPTNQFEEKKVVMEFLKEQKPEPSKTHTKMTSTVNGYGYGRTVMGNSIGPKDGKGNLMRGQSLNYNKKNNANMMENVSHGTKYQENMRGQQKEASKIANQFLTFKLENPKIVTIKK